MRTNEQTPYNDIVRRVGTVVLLLGLLDLGNTIVQMIRGQTQLSLLFAFLFVAGVLIWRGRPSSVRVLSIVVGVGLVLILLLPTLLFATQNGLDLAVLQVRVDPLGKTLEFVQWALFLSVTVWIFIQLSKKEVRTHLADAGKATPDVYAGFVVGVVIVVVLLTVTSVALGGEDARKAIQLASEKVASGQKFSVTSISTTNGHVVANVVAFDENSMQNVKVEWTK